MTGMPNASENAVGEIERWTGAEKKGSEIVGVTCHSVRFIIKTGISANECSCRIEKMQFLGKNLEKKMKI